VFKRIAEASLRHLGIGPTINPPPPVLVARHQNGDAIAPRPARAAALLRNAVNSMPPGVMPDLRGMSAREALRTLTNIGMSARISGDGFVLDQSPAAGSPLVRGESASLRLGRRVPVVPATGVQQ
jgi:cell division protein FtsI (penicillin-binding protein 3)